MIDLRYPIGHFTLPDPISPSLRAKWIDDLRVLPDQLAAEVDGLDEATLAKPYRPGGWNVRQVVHHCADSHLHSFIRFKLALTETDPIIRPYEEQLWAELPDSREGPVADALLSLRGTHRRWVFLLERLEEEQWPRTFFHPASQTRSTLEAALGQYSWHGRHHLAQVQQALGWGG
jgi:hypothetical protein